MHLFAVYIWTTHEEYLAIAVQNFVVIDAVLFIFSTFGWKNAYSCSQNWDFWGI